MASSGYHRWGGSHPSDAQQQNQLYFQQGQQRYLTTPPSGAGPPPSQQPRFPMSGTPPSVGSLPPPYGSIHDNPPMRVQVLRQQQGLSGRAPPPPPPPPNRPPPLIPQQIRHRQHPSHSGNRHHRDRAVGDNRGVEKSSTEFPRVVTSAAEATKADYGTRTSTYTIPQKRRRTDNGVSKNDDDVAKKPGMTGETKVSSLPKSSMGGDAVPSGGSHEDTPSDDESNRKSPPPNTYESTSTDDAGAGGQQTNTTATLNAAPTDKKQAKKKQLEILKAKMALAKQKKEAAERQGALAQAKAKLRAAQERASLPSGILHPISGLSTSLILTKIADNGPENMVYFPSKELDIDFRLKELNRLIQNNDSRGSDDDDEVDESTSSAAAGGNSLAHRRSLLQQELLLLKEKLESKQRAASNDSEDDERAEKEQPVMTKEELQRRREEAQQQMDLSYWRHFVSKQEHILSNVTSQLQDNSSALKQCDLDLETTEKSIENVGNEIEELETREKVVASLVSEAASSLLAKRTELYSVREKQQVSSGMG